MKSFFKGWFASWSGMPGNHILQFLGYAFGNPFAYAPPYIAMLVLAGDGRWAGNPFFRSWTPSTYGLSPLGAILFVAGACALAGLLLTAKYHFVYHPLYRDRSLAGFAAMHRWCFYWLYGVGFITIVPLTVTFNEPNAFGFLMIPLIALQSLAVVTAFILQVLIQLLRLYRGRQHPPGPWGGGSV